MLTFEIGRRIFIARAVTDMRKSFNTLSALVEHQLGHDPYAGDVFVFIGRHRNRPKVLVWDASGFWLWARRLEQERSLFLDRFWRMVVSWPSWC